MGSLYNESESSTYQPEKRIDLCIPGQPIPQKRHRHAKVGNFIQTYDPSYKEKKEFKNKITAYNPNPIPDDHHIFLTLVFGIENPKSTSQKQRNTNLWSKYNTSRADVDNFAKFVMDCCNEVLWKDDSQVVSLTCLKIYSEKPFTKINIMAKKKLEFSGNNEILTHISPTELKELSNACKNMANISLENVEDFMGDYDEKGSPAANTLIDFVRKNSSLITKLSKQLDKWKF